MMKHKLIFFWIMVGVNIGFSQSNQEQLAKIKDQIEIIDSYIEFEIFSLEHEEFMNRMPDHGAELNGYYEHDRLKKMIKKVGEPLADIVTEFYFWNDELIYVNYKQKPYFKTTNDYGQTIMDYSNTSVKYESRHFYHNGERIKSEKVGKEMDQYKAEWVFLLYANKMKSLLDNKFFNKDTYQSLQGKWMFVENSDDYIIFDGTIKFNFYDGRFANRQKTKIEENVLNCWFPKDKKTYRYQIKDVNEKMLTLTDVFSKQDFVYAKVD